MSEASGLQSYLEAWRSTRPETRLLELFAKPSRSEVLFACLVHQIERTIFETRDVKVAATKLSWWHSQANEPIDAVSHPVWMALRAEPHFASVTAKDWQTLFEAGMELLADPEIADFASMQMEFGKLANAIAHIEAKLAGRALRSDDQAIWLRALLLAELREFALRAQRDICWWPMDWRAQLGMPSDVRQPNASNAAKALLQQYQSALQQLPKVPSGSRLNRARLALFELTMTESSDWLDALMRGELEWSRWRTPWRLWWAVRNA